MIIRKIRRGRKICIICVGEVNVIITYIITQTFVITKYSLVIFTSNLQKLYDWFSNYLKLKNHIFNVFNYYSKFMRLYPQYIFSYNIYIREFTNKHLIISLISSTIFLFDFSFNMLIDKFKLNKFGDNSSNSPPICFTSVK